MHNGTRRPPSLSELTPMVLNTELTHLGLEASIYCHKPHLLLHNKTNKKLIPDSNEFNIMNLLGHQIRHNHNGNKDNLL